MLKNKNTEAEPKFIGSYKKDRSDQMCTYEYIPEGVVCLGNFSKNQLKMIMRLKEKLQYLLFSNSTFHVAQNTPKEREIGATIFLCKSRFSRFDNFTVEKKLAEFWR